LFLYHDAARKVSMVSDTQVEQLDNSSVRLTVTVDKDTVKKEYDDLVSEYAKQAQVKGFRKGKVPKNVLEMKFGDSLKAEATQRILENSLKEALDQVDQKPLPYAQPSLDGDLNFEVDQDFTYSVKYDVYPTIEVGEYKGLEIEEPQVDVTDEDMDRELNAIQEQNAMVMDKEDESPIEQNDVVTVDYWEVDDDGNAIEGMERQDFVFTVGSGYNYYKIDDDIVGMKKGDETVLEKEYGDDVDVEELQGQKKRVGVRIKAVKQRDLPEIDDELAQDVSEEYETLDDLKSDIRKRMEETAENHKRQQKVEQLLDKVLENSTVDAPESMLQAELDQAWQNFLQRIGGSDEQIQQLLQAQGRSKDDLLQEWRPDAEKSLKQRLVVSKLMEDEEIQASDEEVDEHIRKQAESSNMSFEDAKQQYEDNNLLEYVRNQLREQKLYDKLLEESTVKQGETVKFVDVVGRNQ
jgi:trigger factor